MTGRPPLKRASYILHVVSVAGLVRRPANGGLALDVVRLLDEVLDLFDSEPRFQHFVLDGQAVALEDYLTARPEAFERIEQAVHQGQLHIGPWYVQIDAGHLGTESLIRNLLIGLRTARIFGRPMLVGFLPACSAPPAQLPQILKGFGVDSALLGSGPVESAIESIFEGDDGTKIICATLRDGLLSLDTPVADGRAAQAPYSESGHVLLPYIWDMELSRRERLNWLYSLPQAQRQLHDSVFHSAPSAYTEALRLYANVHPLPELIGVPRDQNMVPSDSYFHLESLLARWLDPLLAWAENLNDLPEVRRVRRPQHLLQKLWRGLLELQQQALLESDLDADSRANIEQHVRMIEQSVRDLAAGALEDVRHSMGDSVQVKWDGWPTPEDVVGVSTPDFALNTVKLPEDMEREGMIVRGWNRTEQDTWVTLTPWRAFGVVEVVSLDEVPSGGKLVPEDGGAVRFRAEPKHILTFWFHD